MLKPGSILFATVFFKSRARLAASFCLVMAALALAVLPVTHGQRRSLNRAGAPAAASTFGSFLKSLFKRSGAKAPASLAGAALYESAGSACSAPGVLVQTDDSGDEVGDPTTSQLDLNSVSIAEPFTTADDQSITFTIKVNNLTGGPQTN